MILSPGASQLGLSLPAANSQGPMPVIERGYGAGDIYERDRGDRDLPRRLRSIDGRGEPVPLFLIQIQSILTGNEQKDRPAHHIMLMILHHYRTTTSPALSRPPRTLPVSAKKAATGSPCTIHASLRNLSISHSYINSIMSLWCAVSDLVRMGDISPLDVIDPLRYSICGMVQLCANSRMRR